MVKIKKITLYFVLLILTVQNIFFASVYADNDVACILPAVNNSCDSNGEWYSYNQTQNCCVCTDPINSDWSCSSPWYSDNGKWCCVYACSVCSSPSLEFQKYVNFQVEMFQVLQDVVKEPDTKIELTKFGLFVSKVLFIPENTLLSWKKMFQKVSNDFTQASRATQISAIMISNITADIVGKDSIGWIRILFKNQPFVREWSTLQDIDSTIYDLMRNFGTEWIWLDQISSDVRNSIEKLKQKYLADSSNENWLFQEFNFQWNVKYEDIIRSLKSLNSIMKNFLIISQKRIDVTRISNNAIVVKLNDNFVDGLYNSYSCAKWMNACSNSWEEFKKAMRVLPTIKESFSESMKTIKKANDELAKVFAGENNTEVKNEKDNNHSSLTDKQIELLRMVYGVDTSKLTQQQWFWLSTLLNGTAFKNIANSINLKPLDWLSKEIIDINNKAWKLDNENRQDSLYMKEAQNIETQVPQFQPKTLSQEEMLNSMIETSDSVLAEKYSDKRISLFYNNLDTTRYFKEILVLIQNIIDISIGSKDNDGLVKYLWKVCELQCTNKGVENCYFIE